MQPNGSMPPMKEEGMGWDSQLWSGISRGIWLVLTGCSGACRGRKGERGVSIVVGLTDDKSGE